MLGAAGLQWFWPGQEYLCEAGLYPGPVGWTTAHVGFLGFKLSSWGFRLQSVVECFTTCSVLVTEGRVRRSTGCNGNNKPLLLRGWIPCGPGFYWQAVTVHRHGDASVSKLKAKRDKRL